MLLEKLSRRHFLDLSGQAVFLSLGVLFVSTPILGSSLKKPNLSERSLSLLNRHTGESLKKCVFWSQGQYDPEALRLINRLFRDHRTNQTHSIDKRLLDLLTQIAHKMETNEPFQLISGYRSIKTNHSLRENGSGGVAKNSQHTLGKAADIYLPGRTITQLQRAAQSLKGGGVGCYSQFVHIDTGRVRNWGKA